MDREKWIKRYSSNHKILLIGEGDFSFAACLARAFGSGVNITATSLDSHWDLMMKYPSAAYNLAELKQRGCTIIHNIDVTSTLNQHPLLSGKFDRIVFNFPHAPLYYTEGNLLQIELHKKVVRGFMRNAFKLLKLNGEVHVTHKTSYPFNRWGIEELGIEVGLKFVEEVDFSISDYPGYVNKKGSGPNSSKSFPIGVCSTFVFSFTLRDVSEIYVKMITKFNIEVKRFPWMFL